MKIDLSKSIKNLDLTEVEDSSLGKILAQVIVAPNENNDGGVLGPLKSYHIALKLYDTGIVDIDMADWDILKEFVTKTKLLTVLVKGQILEVFSEAKNDD